MPNPETDDVSSDLSHAEIKAMSPEELVERFRLYVHRVARDVYDADRHRMSFEDACAYGYRGLLEAHERFDPDHGAPFMSFAYYRVRGAICDGLRSSAWSGRHCEANLEDHFTERGGDTPPGHYGKREASRDNPRSEAPLDLPEETPVTVLLMHRADIEHLEQTECSPQWHELRRRQVGERLREALETLSEMECELIVRYDLKGETLDSIAEDLDCSRSWASRLRRRVLDELAEMLPHESGDSDGDASMSRERAA